MKRLLFLAQHDIHDDQAWSGIAANIYKELIVHFDEVVEISPIRFYPLFSFMNRILPAAFAHFYEPIDRPTWWQYGAPNQKKITRLIKKYDDGNTILFSIFPDFAVNRPTGMRWCFFSDATFASLSQSYPALFDLDNTTRKRAHNTWQTGVKFADAIVFSSDWARKSAIEDYQASPGKISVVPMGANLTPMNDNYDWDSIYQARLSGTCHLLWIGSDWNRKQGHLAIKVAKTLRERGMDVQLNMIGAAPQEGGPLPDFVNHYGKHFPQKNPQLFEDLFIKSRFFIMPSLAECFGIVFSESASFGLPAIATPVGGIPSALHNSKTGFLVHSEKFVEDSVEIIERLSGEDNSTYLQISKNGRKYFEEKANWKAFSKSLAQILKTL